MIKLIPVLVLLNPICFVYNSNKNISVFRKLSGIMSAAHKIKMKHFENPFPDYSIEEANNLIEGNEIKKDAIIRTCIPERWTKIHQKFNEKLKTNDSTIYTGSTGVAMLYLLKEPDNVENLKRVKELAQPNAIMSKRRVTFLCGDGGPLAIAAVAAHKLGEDSEFKNLIKALLSIKANAVDHKSDLPNEYLYGRAGYLFALLYCNKHISPAPIDESIIASVVEAILKSGQKIAKEGNFKCPLMYEWHDSYYLGAAHGLTGIIYLLLQIPEFLTNEELQTLIKPTIDYLASLQFPSGNYPSSLESQSGDKYVQWCHGAPGFVYMFTSAYRVLKDGRYKDLAIKAADVVWERGLLRKGYSLCHGVSGNAYCFLELYQTTRDVKYLYRAAKFAEWCLHYSKKYEEHPPDRPLSLYEGIAGPMYLLLDIQDPMNAKFPGFTL